MIIEGHRRDLLLELVLEMETRGELKGVTGTKCMTSEQCVRPCDDLRRELHYEHRGQIVVQHGQRAFTSGLGQQTLSRSAHQRRHDLDMRESTRRGNVAEEQASYRNAAPFANIPFRQSTLVEVVHQKRSSRSSSTASETEAPFSISIGRNRAS